MYAGWLSSENALTDAEVKLALESFPEAKFVSRSFGSDGLGKFQVINYTWKGKARALKVEMWWKPSSIVECFEAWKRWGII